jgi:hypothetical protein
MAKKNLIVITGKIDSIYETQQFGQYFEKRLFWLVEDVPKNSNVWELELQQGECVTLDKYKSGELVECTVEITGKKFSKQGKDRVFNALHCTLIKRLQ